MRRLLFKYLAPDRASVLQNGLIRFSQAAALNDPFESTAAVSTAALIEQLKSDADVELEKIVDEYGREGLDPADFDLIETARERAYYQIRSKLTPGRFGRQVIGMTSTQIGILSLSKSSKSVLMWSHYALDHTGFVIGLNALDPFFFQPDGDGRLSEAQDVLYSSLRAEVDLDDPNRYRKLLCQKSIAWKYERETRLFRLLTAENQWGVDGKGIPLHLFSIPQAAICKIIFGANSSAALRSKIFHYTRLNKIVADIYQSKISHNSFRLIFDKINKPYFHHGADWKIVDYVFSQCSESLPFEIEEIFFGQYLYYGVYRYPAPNIPMLCTLDADVPANYTIKYL